MRTVLVIAAMTSVVTAVACGATTTTTQTTASAPLTSAAVTFATLDDGKDADSGVTVQLLRNNAELAAESRMTGVDFDDNTTSAAMVLTMSGPFTVADVNDGQLRVRMTPDGRDDWNFDLRLAMSFADGTTRSFYWPRIVLNNTTPERTLALAPARVP